MLKDDKNDSYLDFHDLEFHIDTSIRYHDRQVRFYELFQNLVLFVAFLFSTASIWSLLDDAGPTWVRDVPAVVTSVLVGMSLVWRVGAKANLHNDLKRQFIRLYQSLEKGRTAKNSDRIAEWTAERLQIELNEPPINRVVHALAYNEVVKSRRPEFKDAKYVKVRIKHRIFNRITRIFDDELELGDSLAQH